MPEIKHYRALNFFIWGSVIFILQIGNLPDFMVKDKARNASSVSGFAVGTLTFALRVPLLKRLLPFSIRSAALQRYSSIIGLLRFAKPKGFLPQERCKVSNLFYSVTKKRGFFRNFAAAIRLQVVKSQRLCGSAFAL